MADHYRETELVSGNKTAKTQEIYRVYLSRWIHPRWGCEYLHNIKPVQVEAWLRSLPLADGSKAKIRNIMSAVFSHGIRYELTDKNPIKSVRQKAARATVPVLLEVSEIYRLFDVLALRERSMVITDALTGIRRGELMGLTTTYKYAGTAKVRVNRTRHRMLWVGLWVGRFGHANQSAVYPPHTAP